MKREPPTRPQQREQWAQGPGAEWQGVQGAGGSCAARGRQFGALGFILSVKEAASLYATNDTLNQNSLREIFLYWLLLPLKKIK